MRKCTREYHYAARYVKRNEDTLRKMRMAECMLNRNDRDFWHENKKMHKGVKVVPPQVDDAISPQEIANTFGEKYKTLYNSVPS